MRSACASNSPPATSATRSPSSKSRVWSGRRGPSGIEAGRPGRLRTCQPGAGSPLQRVPELLAELAGEVLVVEALVLRARVLDLERAHQVADAADGHPVAALFDAEDQAGAERVAAAGRIGDAALVRGRHVVGLAGRVDRGALRALGGDVGLHP